MTLEDAIKIVDATITKEWKSMTSEQKKAFDMVINAILDKQEEACRMRRV